MYALAYPSNTEKKSDRDQNGLNGPVQTSLLGAIRPSKIARLFGRERRVLLRKVSYNRSGNGTVVENYDPGSTGNRIEVFSYDAIGRKTERILQQGSITWKTIYRYVDDKDKDHRIATSETFIQGRSTAFSKHVDIFDSKGDQIAASHTENGVEIKASYDYDYNDEGKLTTIGTYNANKVLYHKVIYAYDSSGNTLMKSSYQPDGLLYDRTIFTYDISKRKAIAEERLIYKDDKSLDFWIVYNYDDRQNAIEVARYDESASLLARTSHALNYDEAGNWIEKITQCWDTNTCKPMAERIEYQVIRYY
ncbi:MAG: hypothetical protein AABN33_07750 [Acidobacteriota bacterium]